MMTTPEAIEICESWFAHLEQRLKKSIEVQELASMARAGHGDKARRLLRQIDDTPVVYDGSRLEPAVRHLVELARHMQRDEGGATHE